MPVIGFLNSTTLEAQVERLAAFQQGLKKEAGFVAGQNVTIDYRSAEGLTDQLPILARDLVRRQVSVMVATSTASAVAAKRATETLPIVFLTGGDPVELGLIASLNRPGGNATGVSFLVNKLVAKRMELLSELAPEHQPRHLVDPNNPNAEPDTNDAQVAADALGRKLLVVKAAAQSELDAAFATLAQKRVATLFVAATLTSLPGEHKSSRWRCATGLPQAIRLATSSWQVVSELWARPGRGNFARPASIQAAFSRAINPPTCL